MPTNTTTVLTEGVKAALDASASLAAATSRTFNWDLRDSLWGLLLVLNTPGGTVAGTRGVRIDCYRRYGTTPTNSASPTISYTLPSAVASTDEDITIPLGPYNWHIKLTNLDAANAVTLEATGDIMSSLLNS